MAWRPAVPLAGLADGVLTEVEVEGERVVVLRLGQEVFAAQGVCPHKFGPLVDGAVRGTMLTCPIHAATFDLRTGAAQPGSVWMGALPTYATRVAAGVVEVDLGA